MLIITTSLAVCRTKTKSFHCAGPNNHRQFLLCLNTWMFLFETPVTSFRASHPSSLQATLGRAWYESATACCWLPAVQTSGHESAAVILSSLGHLSSPVAFMFQSVPSKSQTSGWSRAQRPAVTPGCTAGVAAEVLAELAVPVQLFANDLHSCEIRRKCVE